LTLFSLELKGIVKHSRSFNNAPI